MQWTDEQNVIAVGLALVEAQKPGLFTLEHVQEWVGQSTSGRLFPESRWNSLVRELRRSLPTLSPAIQEHCRTSLTASKRLSMTSHS
jgi:hypothetical protein